jgi:hypothetical protein
MCPTCEQETTFVYISNSNLKDVDTLDDDHAMQNQLDIEMMSLDCTNCKTKEEPVEKCPDYAQFLCKNCLQVHKLMGCDKSHTEVCFEDTKNTYKVNESRLGVQQQKTSNEIIDIRQLKGGSNMDSENESENGTQKTYFGKNLPRFPKGGRNLNDVIDGANGKFRHVTTTRSLTKEFSADKWSKMYKE